MDVAVPAEADDEEPPPELEVAVSEEDLEDMEDMPDIWKQ